MLKEAGEGYQLREPSVPYKVNFDVKNDDIGPENRHFWDINLRSKIEKKVAIFLIPVLKLLQIQKAISYHASIIYHLFSLC